MGDDVICCNNAVYTPCSGETCDPPCVEDNFCDCGLFAEDQFTLKAPGATALPLVSLGRDTSSECEGWPSADFSHRCDTLCLTASNTWIQNNKLGDTYPNNDALTYGDAFCYALYGKWLDQWPAEGVNQRLQSHARMPVCADPQWNEDRIYDAHEQRLCCDGDGNWEYCPIE